MHTADAGQSFWRIAIRVGAEYREDGSAAPVDAFLRGSGGFIHLAPAARGLADPAALRRFYDAPLALRRLNDRSDTKVFRLIAFRGAAVYAGRELGGPAEHRDPDDIAYSWLFVQPAAAAGATWADSACQLAISLRRPCVCRCRADRVAALVNEHGHAVGTVSAPEPIQRAVCANATLVAWGLGDGSSMAIKASLFAAVPHCISSRMMFAARGILKGDDV